MKDSFFLWLLIALLLAGMAFTLLCSPRQSRHGYAACREQENVRSVISRALASTHGSDTLFRLLTGERLSW